MFALQTGSHTSASLIGRKKKEKLHCQKNPDHLLFHALLSDAAKVHYPY